MDPGVAVIGSGYVGTVVAGCFARLGRSVVAVEVDESKLRSLRNGRAPFYESGIDDLILSGIESGRLHFTGDVRFALAASDIVFLCVGTPAGNDGRPDMRAMLAAAQAVGSAIQRPQVLVTKSTVPLGAGNWLASVVEDALPPHVAGDVPFSVVSNPEFLREGSAIEDFLHPDRIVLGSDDSMALDLVAGLYESIAEQSFAGGDPTRKPPLIRTSLVTAEAVKYASNAFLATKISFVNEIANVCDLVGADVADVAAAMGLDTRIGPRFLDAGVGWGGSCFGKDVEALIATAREQGYEPQMLKATVDVNQRQRGRVIKKLQQYLKTLRGRRIALLGLAFKPGTDDMRDAPSIDIAKSLLEMGAIVSAHDPVVRSAPDVPHLNIVEDVYEAIDRADAVVLVTEWPEFLAIDLEEVHRRMRGNFFLDGRNVFDPDTLRELGFHYEGIGRASLRSRSRTLS